ncbi:MAG: polysaccharide deacetylase family protein [Actinobacteria bacterium]|nr:polysaccharide deacetylase family protein [Actinomycetota bacterium]
MRRARKLGRTADAVFLGYHAMVDGGPEYLSMSPSVFEAQLDFLAANGYRSGTRADLDALASGSRLAGKTAFLTFDDGFLDTYEVAAPMLARRGFTGFVFVLPRHLDQGGALAWPEVAGEVRRHPDTMRSMTWDMAADLAERGWEVGAHTLSHPRLTEVDDRRLRDELEGSRSLVAERLGRCDTFAYPFGAWDERVERAAAAVGYRYAFTLPIDAQPGSGPLSIPRLTIDDRDTVNRFRAKISVTGRTLLFSGLRPAIRKLRRHQVHSNAE